MNKPAKKPPSSQEEWLFDLIQSIFVGIYQLILVLARGTVLLWEISLAHQAAVIMGLCLWMLLTWRLGQTLTHLYWLHQLWPALFSGTFLHWLYRFSSDAHFLFLFFGGLALPPLVLGLREKWIETRLQRSFEAIGLTNHFGETPRLLKTLSIDRYREKLKIRASSLGVDRFESKRSDLEAVFQKKILSISQGRNPSVIEITLNTRELPKLVKFPEQPLAQVLKKESFLIGESVEGLLQEKITTLPHLLIAGTTGGGKSVFFKQALLGLLQSSPHLQMYLIDLKGGLEFSDFKRAPNVRVVKTIEAAVQLLEAIEKEMVRRFSYLEEARFKEIAPARDKRDRIVVAVDEASVLYMKRTSRDEETELVKRAREVTDSIAKLGRAAGIHLILATQKVMKETVDTFIQENISARMCFQMNTLHGSLAVLGTKDAMEIPNIPGRGIWLLGNRRIEVQAPWIDGKTIEATCNQLLADFEAGRKSLFSPMLGDLAHGGPAHTLLREMLVHMPESPETLGKEVNHA